jgi:predicted protein tyrosine phosphatase
LSAVESVVEEHRPSHLVSLLDPHDMIDTPRTLGDGAHLKLGMNDIGEPMPGLVEPQEGHLEDLVRFVSDWSGEAPLVIHCWAGISRSTASAFIALCHINGDTPEMEIARLIRKKSPTAKPNRRMVAIADRMFGREGRMMEAVDAMGENSFALEGRLFGLPRQIEID